MSQVIERAGLTKGGFYHHFASKDELLYEVYGDLISRQLEQLDEILARRLPPADTLRALILDLVESTAASAQRALVFWRELHRLGDEHTAAYRQERRRYHDAVRKLIRSGAGVRRVREGRVGRHRHLHDLRRHQRAAAVVPAVRAEEAGPDRDRARRLRPRRIGDELMGWGLTVPQIGMPLLDHQELVKQLPGWGYTDAWSAETSGTDAFVPLALAATWEPTLRLGTAIVPVYTRGPALIAMSAATMAAAAPGRFVLGLGASSPVIVGNWNGLDVRRAVPQDPRRAAHREAGAGGRAGRRRRSTR